MRQWRHLTKELFSVVRRETGRRNAKESDDEENEEEEDLHEKPRSSRVSLTVVTAKLPLTIGRTKSTYPAIFCKLSRYGWS